LRNSDNQSPTQPDRWGKSPAVFGPRGRLTIAQPVTSGTFGWAVFLRLKGLSLREIGGVLIFTCCLCAGGWLATLHAESGSFEDRLANLKTLIAANPTNVELLLQAGDICFDEGAKDSRTAVQQAEGYFRKALELSPTNALARVMLGSTLTMRGRDAFWPNLKLRYVHEGIRQMDAAVAEAPEVPRIRFERAINNMYMPKFMNREEVVKKDFIWLWDRAQDPPKDMDLDLRQNVALFYGLYLKRFGQEEQAERVWLIGQRMAPESRISHEIAGHLKSQVPSEEKIAPEHRR
jgi:tetratricopeptide (TPR) repeat protein